MRHLIDMNDLNLEDIEQLLASAKDIMKFPDKYANVCSRKKLATLFFEPSTRTRLSFEAAMIELGGHVLGFSDAAVSSAAKGESVSDTVRTVGCYADIIAMRHPKEGAPRVASMRSAVPIINAGDGGHNHPTQTLADLCTIKAEFSRLDDLTIGMCGDLKFGRTVHSLVGAMSKRDNIRFVFISPPELRIPDYVRQDLMLQGMNFQETQNLRESLPDLDIIYMTRVQKERFFNEAEYLRLKDTYVLDSRKLTAAKRELKIMHPLPRNNEISPDVDQDPRACYFKQVMYGKYMRMALIMKLLEE